jgi:uncharacterized protein (TIGR02996 family)
LTTPVPALPDSYLRAILALPGDDGPRLCAADWWDERGAAERAEFVRVQCELVTIDRELSEHNSDLKGTCICRRCVILRKAIAPLRRREWELYRGEWDAEVIPAEWVTADESYPAFVYRRGFVEELTATSADFLTHADALTVACPLRRVRLTTWPEVSREVDVERKVLTFTLLVGPRVVQYRDTMLGVLRYQGDAQQVVVSRLLTAAFPGIDFEMPTVEFRPGGLPPSQLPLTTDNVWDVPRGADPRAVAAPREGTSG